MGPSPDAAPPRAGRCATHPGVDQVETCEACGRPLCLACAVAVRGSVIGRECLPRVLEDPPPAGPPPAPVDPHGDGWAMAGFVLVLLLSILPWSRFGGASGPLEAWRLGWSLLAVTAAGVGVVVALVVWRRPRNPRMESALYLALGVLIGLAALLHHNRPPPLSTASVVPLLALIGAAFVLVGALTKYLWVLRARRIRP